MYIGDYLADTQHLSTVQHGAYLLLLMTSWMRGGSVPDNDEILASICKMDSKVWAKAKPVLVEFFDIGDGVWCQKRLCKEYQQAKHISAVNRENGKKGGRPAKPKPKESERITGPQTDQKANGLAKSKRNETPSPSPSQPISETAAASITSGEVTHISTGNGAAAAAADFIFPSNFSSAQQDAVRQLLNGNPAAQLILDELQGRFEINTVRDPVAMLVSLVRQVRENTFIPSHAHRVEAEREGVRVTQEVKAKSGAKP